MTRQNPPFRADHIGSLLRPAELIESRDAFDDGKLSAEKLQAEEDSGIRDVVAMQHRLGLRAVTDGEYRRTSYLVDIMDKLDGVKVTPRADSDWSYSSDDGTEVKATAIEVSAPIRRPEGGLIVEDFKFLNPLVPQGCVAKATIPAPTQMYWFSGPQRIARAAYPDIEAFWQDLIDIWRAEIADLAAAGCTFVQIDETCLPKLADPNMRAILEGRGDNVDALLDRFATVIRAISQNPPAGVTVAMHHCRGNSRGHWQAAGGYESVAEATFQNTGIKTFFLEYDSPRAGNFQPLAKVPKDAVVVLGLMTTKATELESADTLKRRIDEAAKFIDLDRLCISPQCGFSSIHKGHPLSFEDQTRKIERLVEIADDVWG